MYTLIESMHVLTLCVFVGMSVMLDLRLLGLTLRRARATEVIRRVMPWMVAGFVVMVVSGLLLFYAIPVRSYQSVWFRLKLIFLILAGLNAFFFHKTVYRTIDRWDCAHVPPRRARLAGAASLVLWASIIACGRLIAYNWFDCDVPQRALIVWFAGCSTASQ